MFKIYIYVNNENCVINVIKKSLWESYVCVFYIVLLSLSANRLLRWRFPSFQSRSIDKSGVLADSDNKQP